MVKPELAGQTFALDPFEVKRDRIQKFAAATGDSNPIYADRAAAQAAGYADTPLPPTFGAVAGYWALDTATQQAELGVPIAGMLHGEEEYFYLAPIRPGDTLIGQQRIASVIERKGKAGSMQLVTLETTYTDQTGQAVLRSRTVIVLPENMQPGQSQETV